MTNSPTTPPPPTTGGSGGRGRGSGGGGRGHSRGRGRGRGGRSGRGGGGGRGYYNNNHHRYYNNKNRRGGGNNNNNYHRGYNNSSSSSLTPGRMTDEDVLVAFAPLLRSDDPEAKRIFEQFKDDREQMTDAVRNYLETTTTASRPPSSKGPTDATTTTATTTATTASTKEDDAKETSTAKGGDGSGKRRPPNKPRGKKNNKHINKDVVSASSKVVDGATTTEVAKSGEDTSSLPSERKDVAAAAVEDGVGNDSKETLGAVADATVSIKNDNGARSKAVTTSAPPVIPPKAPTPQPPPPPKAVTPVISTPPPALQPPPQPTLPSPPPPIPPSTPSKPPPPPHSSPTPTTPPRQPPPSPPTAIPPKHPPKRLMRNQPGTILTNTLPPHHPPLHLRPRSELTARWSLPLTHLRQQHTPNSKSPPTIDQALASLSIGLFRLGCPENGRQGAIVSKEIVPTDGSKGFRWSVDGGRDEVWGEVPFYAPRSPGTIVLRLFFERDRVGTLATGVRMVVDANRDVEMTLRFILSNFKSKKGSGLSGLHSLSLIFENYVSPPPQQQQQRHHHHHHNNNDNAAGRVAWGGICESRKIVDSCEAEHRKRMAKVTKMEEKLLAIKAKNTAAAKEGEEEEEEEGKDGDEEDGEEESEVKESPKQKQQNGNDDDGENEEVETLTGDKWRIKMNSVMGEKASIERKWRDVQFSYAAILRAAISNPQISTLLRRDLIAKLRLEYELYCPVCESLATNPYQQTTTDTNNSHLPHPITTNHFAQFAKSRSDMQLETLGFVPRTETIKQLLSHPNTQNLFQRLTATMHQSHSDTSPNAEFYHCRETIRSKLEDIVKRCPDFPPGTTVVVFGSSANGFGSSTSDLDMCLQLPQSTSILSEDQTGKTSMGHLAQQLEINGMKNVNTNRLTARIPVVKFDYPLEDDVLLECDISMQNPLACLNTSLLLTYSSIDPRIRVLASIIKKWAKARDINNPSHHTLSSYGYLLMMLHFLTRKRRDDSSPSTTPLLPNLQWIDPASASKAEYRERRERLSHPQCLIPHPTEPSFTVNTFFFRPTDPPSLSRLQRLTSQNRLPSVGVLLASFFRYYAYEFDYKKHVVSLSPQEVSKEEKSETEGWRLYGVLSIEDPFETFYDVAHVLKMGTWGRMRKEFVRGYTKIVEGGERGMGGDDVLEWICEPVKKDRA